MPDQPNGKRSEPRIPRDIFLVLEILDLVSQGQENVPISRLRGQLDQPPQVVEATVRELVELGWLEQESPDQPVVSGPRLRDWAVRVRAQRHRRSTDAHKGPDAVGQ